MKWEEIKKTREDLGMTQAQVSRAVGVGLSTYRYWECGGGTPKPVNMKKLKEVLWGKE